MSDNYRVLPDHDRCLTLLEKSRNNCSILSVIVLFETALILLLLFNS